MLLEDIWVCKTQNSVERSDWRGCTDTVVCPLHESLDFYLFIAVEWLFRADNLFNSGMCLLLSGFPIVIRPKKDVFSCHVKTPSPDPTVSDAIRTRNPTPYWVFDKCWGKTEAPVLVLNFLFSPSAAGISSGMGNPYLWCACAAAGVGDTSLAAFSQKKRAVISLQCFDDWAITWKGCLALSQRAHPMLRQVLQGCSSQTTREGSATCLVITT